MRVSVNAHLSFGMVNVPVGVSPSTNRTPEFKLRQLHAKCGNPVHQDLVCTTCHEGDLDRSDLVKGYEVTKGNYVVFTQAEIDRIKPERSPIIGIKRFAPDGMVNVVGLMNTSYWLVPNPAFEAAYSVLSYAMAELDAVGLGVCSLWGKEHLFAIEALPSGSDSHGGPMKLNLLHSPSEVILPDFVINASVGAAGEMAIEVVKQMMHSELTPQQMAPGTEEMQKLVQAKLAGKELEAKAPEPVSATVNLMEALRMTVKAKDAKPKPKRVGKKVA